MLLIFSFLVEEVFKITDRKGMTLIGTSEGVIKNGDILTDRNCTTKQFKVIGVEMVDYINNLEKRLTHNPALIVDAEYNEVIELKGKILVSLS